MEKRKIHLANTDFELELVEPHLHDSFQVWEKYSYCLQLQFLPFLYAKAGEYIALTEMPSASYLQQLTVLLGCQMSDLATPVLIHQPPFASECISWGASQKVALWAQSHSVNYHLPAWHSVQHINSKLFSFLNSEPLRGAQLIWNLKDLNKWYAYKKGIWVLKTCFGFSGRGHYFVENRSLEDIAHWCQKEWQQQRPLIAEPWVERCLDFSTQWMISQQGMIHYIGATCFENSALGSYQGTFVGKDISLFSDDKIFLDTHIERVQPLLEKMYECGFFGHVGIDAFVYLDQQKKELQPIVEVNGRQTMSLVALLLQQLHFPQKTIHLRFCKTENQLSLLPFYVGSKRFTKNLVLDLY